MKRCFDNQIPIPTQNKIDIVGKKMKGVSVLDEKRTFNFEMTSWKNIMRKKIRQKCSYESLSLETV